MSTTNKITNNSVWKRLMLIISMTLMVSCNRDELTIQQNYPFEIIILPVPKEIAKGETVEIRLKIKRSGMYTEAQYFMRYFQFEGGGALRYYNDPPYTPNDLYELQNDEFRLYYTSNSDGSESFSIWISDAVGDEKEIQFQFNSKDK